jgi:hypothetical protein
MYVKSWKIRARREGDVEVLCCCLEMARQARLTKHGELASFRKGFSSRPWKSPLEILRDAVDQALNATTALFNTLTTKAAFHSTRQDLKNSGWLSHKRLEILAMRPSR